MRARRILWKEWTLVCLENLSCGKSHSVTLFGGV